MAKKTEDTASEATPTTARASAPLLTVAELGAKYEPRKLPGPKGFTVGEDPPFSRNHLGADCAHGWTRHKAYKSEDVRLSDADYLAAVAAFKVGKIHEPANARALTVFSEAEMEARLARDKAAPKPKKQRKAWTQAQAHAAVMVKARHWANIGKTLANMKNGAK